MPQSLSKIYVHVVFSTKYRQRIIHDEVRPKLHSYMVKTFSALGSYVHEIYANPDHVHILCVLPRTITIAELVSKVKSSSSKWLKTQGIENFTWQRGYAVFFFFANQVYCLCRVILKINMSIIKQKHIKMRYVSF